MEGERDLDPQFEFADRVALRPAHTLGNGIELSEFSAEQRENLVRFPEIARTQNDCMRFIRTLCVRH
jgi:hypothetical protein